MLNTEKLYENTWTIEAIVKNTECMVKTYIDSLVVADRTKVLALLERTAAHGPLTNDQKFKKLSGKIFEFKSSQDRLFCFFDGKQRIVITHGWKKKDARADKGEIQRAVQLMNEYLS